MFKMCECCQYNSLKCMGIKMANVIRYTQIERDAAVKKVKCMLGGTIRKGIEK